MRKFLLLLLCLFCFTGFTQNRQITSSVIIANAHGVDALWDMEITDTGEFNPGKANQEDQKTDFNKMLDNYKAIALFIVGIITITAFFSMIIQFVKLAIAGSNEQKRKKASTGIMVCGIGLALMGATGLIIGVLWNAFK